MDFAQVYQSKAIKTANIKAMLVSNYPELDGIANSTLNKWMKNHCWLSYKRLEKKPVTAILPQNIRKVFEAAYVLTELINKGIELIYFDELLSTRDIFNSRDGHHEVEKDLLSYKKNDLQWVS